MPKVRRKQAIFLCHRPRPDRHEVDDERSPLPVRHVRRGVMQRLAMVKHAPARGEFVHHRLALVDQLFHVEQRVGRCRMVVPDRLQMTARDHLHRAVVNVHVVRRQPHRYI